MPLPRTHTHEHPRVHPRTRTQVCRVGSVSSGPATAHELRTTHQPGRPARRDRTQRQSESAQNSQHAPRPTKPQIADVPVCTLQGTPPWKRDHPQLGRACQRGRQLAAAQTEMKNGDRTSGCLSRVTTRREARYAVVSVSTAKARQAPSTTDIPVGSTRRCPGRRRWESGT